MKSTRILDGQFAYQVFEEDINDEEEENKEDLELCETNEIKDTIYASCEERWR